MKVAITGTFSSGKTTLCADIQRVLTNVQVVPDTARMLKNSLMSIDFSSPIVRGFLLIQQLLVEQQQYSISNQSLLIVDGGIEINFANELCLNNTHYCLEFYKSQDHIPYDLTIICDPSEVQIENDGIRLEDSELRTQIHDALLTFLPLTCKRSLLVTGNRQERKEIVLNQIALET